MTHFSLKRYMISFLGFSHMDSRGLITKFRLFISFLHYVADPNKQGIGNYWK